MTNRQQRRQGVIYGPVRPPDGGRDAGAILGRVLGLVMLVLAVGVLGVGAVAFLNDRAGGAATPAATRVAEFSAAPSVSLEPLATPPPTTPASLVPSAPPSDPPSPAPSPEPTPFVPTVQVGPGHVTFGTRSDSGLAILDPRATFAEGERVRWSAHLIERADSADLRVRVVKLDPAAADGERVIREDEVKPVVTDERIFLRRFRPARFLEGPGVYAVRYMRDETVMAEGYLQIEE